MWEFAPRLPDSTHVWLSASWEHPVGARQDASSCTTGFDCVPGDPKIPGVTRQTGRDEERVTGTTGTVPSPSPSPPSPVAQQLPEHSPAATWRPSPALHQHSDTGGSTKSSAPPRLPPGATGELPTPAKQRKSLGLSKLSLFQMLKDEFFVLSTLINQPKYIFFFKKSNPFGTIV